MKMLIVGSNGFIGSHCVQYFSQEHEIVEADVANDYSNPNYIQIDLLNDLSGILFKGKKFDVCLNCAGAASVPFSFMEPFSDFSKNVFLVAKLLEGIREYQPECVFVNLSSAAVYGNPSSLPVNEKAQAAPLSPYGYHKLMSELLVKEYAMLFGLRTISLRLFSVFGPGLRKQIFWDWHRQIQDKGFLNIIGDGKESRDFIFVNDAVRAIDLVLSKVDCNGQQINIASGQGYSISEVLEIFKEIYPKRFDHRFQTNKRPGDPTNWCADISELKALGFEPSFDLKTGLKKHIEWLSKDFG